MVSKKKWIKIIIFVIISALSIYYKLPEIVVPKYAWIGWSALLMSMGLIGIILFDKSYNGK